MDNLSEDKEIFDNKIEQTDVYDEDTPKAKDSLEEESFFGGGDKTYVKKEDKYSDVRSSAFTMLIVGGLGLLLVVLLITDIIKIPFNPDTSWLYYGIMIVVFAAFVVAGFFSYMKSINLNEEAKIENKKIDEINEWAKENISQDVIDSGLDLNETIEILYFTRFDKIKNKLMHQFEDVDEGLIDLLSENIYTKIYEDDEDYDEEYDHK